jgi:hypothetical protein
MEGSRLPLERFQLPRKDATIDWKDTKDLWKDTKDRWKDINSSMIDYFIEFYTNMVLSIVIQVYHTFQNARVMAEAWFLRGRGTQSKLCRVSFSR